MAGQRLLEWFDSLPDFVREDIPEGVAVGALAAVPVALQPNQDPHEQAAAVAGGIGAGILGGAAARHLGAAVGRRLHSGPVEPGSFWANLGSTAGRPSTMQMVREMAVDGVPKEVTVTGEHVGRAVGRLLGDEVSAIAGTGGALALAQQMDTTPDVAPQPDAVGVLANALPGAGASAALSLASGGLVDLPGAIRGLQQPGAKDPWEVLRQNSVFRRKA